MYKIVVTTPAGDFTLDKVYSSVSEANEYIETLYKHFDETASFKVVLADDTSTNTFVERLEAMLDTFENKKDSMSNKELQQFALNLLKTSIMREKAHDSTDKLLASITRES